MIKDLVLTELNRRKSIYTKDIEDLQMEIQKLEEKKKEISHIRMHTKLKAQNKKLRKELSQIHKSYDREISALRNQIDVLGGNEEIESKTNTVLSNREAYIEHIQQNGDISLLDDIPAEDIHKVSIKLHYEPKVDIMEFQKHPEGVEIKHLKFDVEQKKPIKLIHERGILSKDEE